MELSLPQVKNQLLLLMNRERAHGYEIEIDYPGASLWLVKDGERKFLVNRQEINAGMWKVAATRLSRELARGQ